MIYILLTWLFSPLLYLRLALRHRNPEPREILLIQTAKIGDMICTTPLLRAIKRRYPVARLTVLLHPDTEPILAHNPHVDGILRYCPQDFRGLRGKRRLVALFRQGDFDTTICVSPNLAFLLAPLWAVVPHRLAVLANYGGISYRLAAPFLTAGEPHATGRLLLDTEFLLLQQLGIEAISRDKEVYAAPGAEEKVMALLPSAPHPSLVGVGLSSGNKLKELGTAKLCTLIGLLLEKTTCHVVLIGSKADRAQGEEIITYLGPGRLTNTAGTLDLGELPALIRLLDIYLGVDSGITYMADALDVPLIDIMGPADADDQRPTGARAIVIRPDLPCAPCSHAFLAPYHCASGARSCITEIDLSQIADLALDNLKQHNQTRIQV